MNLLNTHNPICTCGAELDPEIDAVTTLDWSETQDHEEGYFTCEVECPGCGKIWIVDYEVEDVPTFNVTEIRE